MLSIWSYILVWPSILSLLHLQIRAFPQSSPEKFLGVDGNQHRNPLLTDVRTWEISALNGMSISYSSPQGSGMWKRSRKIVKTRSGAPERQHFPNTTGEDAIRSMHEICRSSSYPKPQDREGEVGKRPPSQKALHN